MVNKWEVYYVNLNPTKGSEQQGIRPVLVVSNDAVNHNLPVFTCIPFSSIRPGAIIYPTEVKLTKTESGLPKESVLMLQQIRTVANTRVSGPHVSKITNEKVQKQINSALMQYFELD